MADYNRLTDYFSEQETITMAKKAKLLDVPVAFGNVTIGDESASIVLSIDREHLNPETADGLLCGCRVQAVIEAGEASATNDPDKQKTFPAMEHSKVLPLRSKATRFGLRQSGRP